MAFIVEEKGKPTAAAAKRGSKAKPKSAYRVDWTEPKPPLPDGTPARGSSRKSLWLGQVTRGMAEAVCGHVEELRAAKASQRPPVPRTADWLDALPDELYGKLVGLGLVPRRAVAVVVTLFDFIDDYLAKRSTPANVLTIRCFRQSLRWFREFFPADQQLAGITTLQVEQFRDYCRNEGQSENTVRTHLKNLRTILNAALKGRLIAENPAKGQKCSILARPERMHFVTLDQTQKLLDACPDADWRAIVALARFGGLRCPSEVLAVRWQDVDWSNNRLKVRSPKTAHHGKAERLIPLFPELRAVLAECFEVASEGAVYVVGRYRDRDTNLRTHFTRIVERAGLAPWERLFQNLRMSRETELAQTWPLHLVVAWMGNTTTVAQKHYLMLREEDFDRAAASPSEVTHKITHKTECHPAASSGNSQPSGSRKRREISGNHRVCGVFKAVSQIRENAKRYPREDSNL